jgi:phage terminase large subunit
MDSIAESVHFLLEKRIYELGLERFYKVLQYTILGPEFAGYGRTEFIFAGLRHNVRKIKSLEGCTVAWVEEAANVSKDSWDTLLPTIRWEDTQTKRESEIWVTFNPELVTDDTYRRWILNPPPHTVVVRTSYKDNRWLTGPLEIQMKEARRRYNLAIQQGNTNSPDISDYLHIWEGECVQALRGAIYSAELQAADKEGRICNLPYDRTRPVHTFWDLGFGDKTAIWCAQIVNGWYHLIDYLEDSQKPISYYVVELQQRGYVYGVHWLPHDGVDALLHQKLANNDKSKSPEMLMRAAGLKVRISPKLAITSGINMGRMIFSQCRFDQERCADGLQAMRHYQWGEPAASGQERSKPLHDWASHAADAFRTFAVSAKDTDRPKIPPAPPAPKRNEFSWMG